MTGLEVALIGGAAKALGAPLGKMLSQLGADKAKDLLVQYTKCFGDHERISYDKCKRIKNIMYRDVSVELRDKYVNVEFYSSAKDERILDTEIIDLADDKRCILVSGTAGAGKTMFLRFLVLSLVERKLEFQRMPIYLEFRYLSEIDLRAGLLRAIFNKCSKKTSDKDFETFLRGMDFGLFAFVLDAVDETPTALVDQVTKELHDILLKYPENSYFVSTRPDDQLESIQSFEVLHTTDMSLGQVVAVIERLDYDEDVKNKLIRDLKEGLYDDHSDLLSNPLLVTIMLLSYDQSPEVPTKLSTFYNQAFHALYQRHDAAKGAFKRDLSAGLPLDDFERFFSAFSYLTLANAKLEFGTAEAIQYIKEALAYAQLDVDPRKLFQDTVKSVCLLQPDGLKYVFVHRSFQEYFAALFIKEYRDPDRGDVINECMQFFRSGNFIKLLDELDPYAIDVDWLKPRVSEWLAKVEGLDLSKEAGLRKMMEITLPHFSMSDGRITGVAVDFGCSMPWMIPVDSTGDRPGSLRRFVYREAPRVNFDRAAISRLSGSDQFFRKIDAPDETTSRGINLDDAKFLLRSDIPQKFDDLRRDYASFLQRLEQRERERREAKRVFLRKAQSN